MIPAPTIRFKPFSHQAGTMCLLPGSHLAFQIYPALVCVFDYSLAENPLVAAFRLANLGPIDKFCVLQDQETGKIIVSGFVKAGFVRYVITSVQDPKEFNVAFEKLPTKTVIEFGKRSYKVVCDDNVISATATVDVGNKIAFFNGDKPSGFFVFGSRERLFLGIDKSQNWPQVLQRCCMKEIVPYLYWLSQSIGQLNDKITDGPSLLQNVRMASRENVLTHFKDLFVAGFHQLLIPRLQDNDFHGYDLPLVYDQKIPPLAMLRGVFEAIRGLFFLENDKQLKVLPLLPTELPCGMLSSITTVKGHKITIEWTKHLIRRVFIEATCDDEIIFSFQNQITSCRLGKVRINTPATIKIRQKQTYLLDNFQK